MRTVKHFVFTIAVALLFFTVAASAQEKNDNIKLGVGYVGTESKFDPNEVAEYLNGFWVDVDGKILAKGGFRLGGVFNYTRTFDVTQLDPMTYPKDPLPPATMGAAMPMATAFDVVRRDTNTFSFGPRLSYKAGPVEPFATALFGFRNPTDVSTRHFVRRYQLGADVNLGHFFVRPFFLEYEFVQGFAGPSTHRYGAGAGFRF